MASIYNLPGRLPISVLYPASPLEQLIKSVAGGALPDLTARTVVITGKNKRVVLPSNLQVSLDRISATLYAVRASEELIGLLYAAYPGGFDVEFVTTNRDTVMRMHYDFSLETTVDDTDLTTLTIAIDDTSYVLEVSLPLRTQWDGTGNTPNPFQIKVWRAGALAASANKTKVISSPIPIRPAAEPLIMLFFFQDVGTLQHSFYWSGDGGVTATPPTNGQYIPNAGDYLYVNPVILDFVVAANDPIAIIYFYN